MFWVREWYVFADKQLLSATCLSTNPYHKRGSGRCFRTNDLCCNRLSADPYLGPRDTRSQTGKMRSLPLIYENSLISAGITPKLIQISYTIDPKVTGRVIVSASIPDAAREEIGEVRLTWAFPKDPKLLSHYFGNDNESVRYILTL